MMIIVVLMVLADAGLAKRIRSAVITASLVVAMINSDGAAVLQLLQVRA